MTVLSTCFDRRQNLELVKYVRCRVRNTKDFVATIFCQLSFIDVAQVRAVPFRPHKSIRGSIIYNVDCRGTFVYIRGEGNRCFEMFG